MASLLSGAGQHALMSFGMDSCRTARNRLISAVQGKNLEKNSITISMRYETNKKILKKYQKILAIK